MRLYGRITIYGEYLMHNLSEGLIIKSKYFLETNGTILHPYNINIDSVAMYLSQQGFQCTPKLFGNLPLGFGFGGSTILNFLHLHSNNVNDKKSLINEIDRKIHGFEPSGLDYSFCERQLDGLFLSGNWHTVSFNMPDYTIALPLKERGKSLKDVKDKIVESELHSIVTVLNTCLKKSNRLNFDLLMDYAIELANLKVYNNSTQLIIQYLLKNKIIAKTIGGIYDKALIIVWRDNDEKHFYLKHLKSKKNIHII